MKLIDIWPHSPKLSRNTRFKLISALFLQNQLRSGNYLFFFFLISAEFNIVDHVCLPESLYPFPSVLLLSSGYSLTAPVPSLWVFSFKGQNKKMAIKCLAHYLHRVSALLV